MLKNNKNDYLAWVIMIGSIILILEVLFFNRRIIFSLFITAGMIYLGRKKYGGGMGKTLFWLGIVFFCGSILNMIAFKFLIIAVLLNFFIQYTQSKKNPKKVSPILVEPKITKKDETIVISKPLLENTLFGNQKTPDGAYEWNDINIQAGIGDTVIDLSYTVLPKGKTVIFIRNIIGNIHILVPYDIEVSICHSVIAGTTTMFDFHQSKMFNQVYHLKTSEYDQAEQRVKIFTSLVVGNLEVSRI